ncbi:hypothetical protein ElyMa_001052700 [Elysia marginata]|uniref:Secreted protein n=1 Tax=Elysia marginata TaxID=1093978 RepID=A0AAV4HP84_9GAST|nr:hypothetical protein ElyMa_001052700 [Elysia marginata]
MGYIISLFLCLPSRESALPAFDSVSSALYSSALSRTMSLRLGSRRFSRADFSPLASSGKLSTWVLSSFMPDAQTSAAGVSRPQNEANSGAVPRQ